MCNNLKKSICCVTCVLILSYCVSAYAINPKKVESPFQVHMKKALLAEKGTPTQLKDALE